MFTLYINNKNINLLFNFIINHPFHIFKIHLIWEVVVDQLKKFKIATQLKGFQTKKHITKIISHA